MKPYLYIHIFYIYTYTKPCIGWKNQGYKTLRQLHTDPTIGFSGPLSPRRWGFLASPWILLEDDPTPKMCFLFSRSSRQSSWNPPLFLHFSKMHQESLLANVDLRPFLFHTSSYYQHKHCTIEGNQSGNPAFLPYNLHQVWSHQNGWHLIWAPAEPSRPGPGPVSDHLGVELSSLCHMTINKNWIKQNVGW